MQQWFHIAGHWQAPINFHRVLDAFKISSNKGHDNHGRRLVKNIGCTGKLKYCGPKVHGKSDKCMGICHRPIRWHNLSLNKPFVKALSHLRIVDLCIIFNGVTEKLFQSQTIRVGLYPVFCAKPLTCPLRLQRTSSTELVTKLWYMHAQPHESACGQWHCIGLCIADAWPFACWWPALVLCILTHARRSSSKSGTSHLPR